MKTLVKIAPIVVIVACGASLFFAFKLSGIKTGLEEDKQDLTAKLGTKESQLAQAQDDLAETKTELKQAEDKTIEVEAQLHAEKVKLTQKTREAEDLATTVARLEADVKTAEEAKADAEKSVERIQQAMKDVGLTDLSEIDTVREKIEAMTEKSRVLEDEKVVLADKVKKLEAEVAELKTTPEGLRGKVAVAKSMWNFVVLDVGAEDKVQPEARFIVYRDNQLVGKARVTTVYPSSSVAELVPSFTQTPPRAGDIVIHEKL